MTDEELVLLNCVLYDRTLAQHQGRTLFQWADSVDPAVLGQGKPGGMDEGMWRNVIATIHNHPRLPAAKIVHVFERPPDPDQPERHGTNATFLDPDTSTAVIAFSGTQTDPEWGDNAQGAHIEVSDTGEQQAANDYFLQQVAENPAARAVIATGHSKGGNLAMYAAVVNPGTATRTVNLNGQGFGAAFCTKYHDQIEAEKNKITTYATSMDYVNIMFTSIAGTRIYVEPGLPSSQVIDHHWVYFLLEPAEDGSLRLRPPAGQNHGMAAIRELAEFLGKFMSATSYALLMDMAMGLKQYPQTVTIDDIFNRASLQEAIRTSGFSPSNLFSRYVNQPYRSAFAEVFALSRAFFQDGGMTAEQWAAINGFLYELLQPVLSGLGKVLGTLGGWLLKTTGGLRGVIKAGLSMAGPLPYSAVVRDFTSQTENELVAMADQPRPRLRLIRPKLPDPRHHLDFHADEAARRAHYADCIRRLDMTQDQIKGVFRNVRAVDNSYAKRVRQVVDQARRAKVQLDGLMDALTAVGSAVRKETTADDASTTGTPPNRGDLVIADWEFLHAEQMLTVYLDTMIDASARLAGILEMVGREAVRNGSPGIAADCGHLAGPAYDVAQILESVRQELNGTATTFVTEIDRRDVFMY